MGPIQSGINQIVQSALHAGIVAKGAKKLGNIEKSVNKLDNTLSNQWAEKVKKGEMIKEDAEAFASASITPKQQSEDMRYILDTELNNLLPPEGFDERMAAAEKAFKRSGNDVMAEKASKKIDQINKFSNIKEMLEGSRGEILG